MTPPDCPTSELNGLERLAQDALALWDMPQGARARLMNLSENATFRVDAPGGVASVLRIHRSDYNDAQAIASELAWIRALGQAGALRVPGVIAGRNGRLVQQGQGPGMRRAQHMVMFEFLAGQHLDEAGDLVPGFEQLGAIAARAHLHAETWQRPAGFRRRAWDLEAVFGPHAPWGDWRAAPGVTPDIRARLERVETRLRARLGAYGMGPGRYGLIHADMRLANVLVDAAGPRLIDFDDCGFGWFLYDFAAAVSFVETDPRLPALRRAWLRGYEGLRPLAPADRAMMGSFVMLRRMALLAWIGSRAGAPEPRALAPHFAQGTADLGAAWLSAEGTAD